MVSSLSSLLKSGDPDPSEVVQAAEAVLSQSKGDTAAQQAKLVALLQLDRFEDAASFADASGKALHGAAAVEYAYALYKVGRLEEARKIVQGSEELGARYLEAQLSYRSEDFDNARQIYEDLWENKEESEESDLRVNRGSVNAQIHWTKLGDVPVQRTTREDLEIFETAYNAACSSLARGEYAQGEMLLKRAKELCSSSENLSEEEKKAELLPITVQQLYALSVQGKTAEAEKIANNLAITDTLDLSTRQIAQVNQIALNAQPSNPYLAQRILESLPTLPASDKLFGIQSCKMRQNRVALDLLVSKFKAAANSTKSDSSSISNRSLDINDITSSAQHAAAKAQNQLGKLGIEAVNKLRLSDESNVGFVLVLVQLYILTKNHGAAISVMEGLMNHLEQNKSPGSSDSRLHDLRFAPGLVAVLVSLYGIENRRGHIQKELGKAASYWKRKPRSQTRLFNAAGLALLASGRPDDLSQAGEIFEAAKTAEPNDITAIAGYVASLATSDHSKVVTDVKKLTSVEKLTAGIDSAALDEAGIPQLKPAGKAVRQKRAAAAGAEKPAKKRFRKSRLPKDYDAEKKPDPERWLPLRDRSSYKPKGKKGKQKQQALTQGGIAKEGTEEGGSDAAKTSVVKASSGVGGGGGKNKKGRKKK